MPCFPHPPRWVLFAVLIAIAGSVYFATLANGNSQLLQTSHIAEAAHRDSSLATRTPVERPHPVLAAETVQADSGGYPPAVDHTAWVHTFSAPGFIGEVFALATRGTDVYAGGWIQSINEQPMNHIVRWDGHRWSSMGSGFNGPVKALTFFGNDLVAAGDFSHAGEIPVPGLARWDGQRWTAIGEALPFSVLTLLATDQGLFAGGQSSDPNQSPLARWDGTRWTIIPGLKGIVYALALGGETLYVGGSFARVGDQQVNNIAKWDRDHWSGMETGVDSTVTALAWFQGRLYVGGNFIRVGHIYSRSLAVWNGGNWEHFGSGGSRIKAIVPYGRGLAFLGYFYDGTQGSELMVWDGSRFGLIPEAPIISYAVATSGDDIFVGARGGLINGRPEPAVSRWSAGIWTPLVTGQATDLNGSVADLADDGRNVYAAGSFSHAGTELMSYLARWTGTEWQRLGNGPELGGPLSAVAVSGETVYAAGLSPAGSSHRRHTGIAKWDGQDWGPLGAGVEGTIRAIVVDGDTVYVGGDISKAGGIPVRHVAKWDGQQWSTLGDGFEKPVNALTVFRGQLYAGTSVNLFGGETSGGLLRWDGTTWLPAEQGVYGYISALAANENALFVGGVLRAPGGQNLGGLAKWDGTNWTSASTNQVIEDISLADDAVFLLGNGWLGLWDGQAVYSLGSPYAGAPPGVQPGVRSLTILGEDIYVGGDFMQAGGKRSPGIAHLRRTAADVQTSIGTPMPTDRGLAIPLTIRNIGPSAAQNVNLDIDLAGSIRGAALESSLGGCSLTSPTEGRCSWATLGPDTTVSLAVNSRTRGWEPITVTAQITGTVFDPQKLNNQAQVIHQPPVPTATPTYSPTPVGTPALYLYIPIARSSLDVGW